MSTKKIVTLGIISAVFLLPALTLLWSNILFGVTYSPETIGIVIPMFVMGIVAIGPVAIEME